MPTSAMPERPHLDNFRRQARALQRAARAGDPDALARLARHHAGGPRLSAAQLVVAREHGFASWPRLVRYLGTAAEHGWDTRLGAAPAADPAEEFCRLACLTYSREDGPGRWARARRLLAEHPGLTSRHIWAAAAAARPDDVGRLLAEQPRLVAQRGGPFRWRPLFHLVYSRFDEAVPAERVLAVARLLLDAGADPDDGYLFDALPSPFTLLTGVFGHGELGSRRQPRHPHWRALGRLLLDAGADPNDAQALYNRMFEPDDSHLELLFEYGLGTGDGGPWRARVPELGTPARMLRTQLRWAVEHHQPARVRLLVEHGVDFRSPFEDDGPAWSPGDGRTAVELARLGGDAEIADHLVARGAVPPGPDPVGELVAAAFRGDRSAVDRVRAEHPGVVAEARRSRPGLVVWAAARGSVETVGLLVGLGFDVNAYGRGDAPVEEAWETALHRGAMAGDVELTRRLLALGADPDLRDRRFDATPLDWARHFHQSSTADLLGPVTTPSASGG
ncbi:ankyrin repeat domain-containing protein [Saccharothrix syringae]|uniref:Ankyrin repeat domain-containing protein n=1 Tax=Saccharothrix syringae TaxID=103733 RepID=A0A5Q0GW60_SACSY|nr:ankyrin repeat domain-containing protein [Saccharothrix syringae]QFZ18366.1 ankyrin repeat domain-containing protein [Saccharothrix syringae]